MSQQTASEHKKTAEKCGCNKKLADLEKQVSDLRAEIALLRAVLQGGR